MGAGKSSQKDSAEPQTEKKVTLPLSVAGHHQIVVDAPLLTINELAGNVATKEDTLSIALVKASKGSDEPWLNLKFDEWICVLKGQVVYEVQEHPNAPLHKVEAKAGQTVRIQKNTRCKPTFPVDTEYIPVCIPAFRPDRCVRENEGQEHEQISDNLKKLHGQTEPVVVQNVPSQVNEKSPEILYHMLTLQEWEDAKASGYAYYPKTYEQDGYFTHATGVPSRLVETANHFYQDVAGDWICLEFTRDSLKRSGIHVRDEEAAPVGDKAVNSEWVENWICPHIIGGIPCGIVDKIYKMERDGKRFVKIVGLTNGQAV